MITTLRKSFKSRIYKIVLWITLLATAGVFSFIELARNFFTSQSAWVLRVNNTTVSQTDYLRAVADQEERLRLLRSQYGEYADVYFQILGIKPIPQELAFDALTQKALLNQAASKISVSVSSELIQEKLRDIAFTYQELSDMVPLFVWDMSVGDINVVLLRNYLQRMGLTMADLDKSAVRAIKRQLLVRLVELGQYAPAMELRAQFIKTTVPHKFSIMTISGADMLARVKTQAVTDETLKAFFEAQNSQSRRYAVPEKRSALVATFTPEAYGITVGADEVETYYNNHKAEYIEKPAQVQVRHIFMAIADPAKRAEVEQKMNDLRRQALAHPASFAELAKSYSQDKATASQGGLVSFFSKGYKDPAFERASFLLPTQGAISEVIATKDGLELIQLVEKKAQSFKPFASVAADIRKTLTKRLFNEQFTADIRVAQHMNTQELHAFIARKHGKETTVSDLPYTDSVLARTLFKLGKGEKTSYYEGDAGVLVCLTSIQESYIPSFDSLKPTIKQDYYAHQATLEMKHSLEKLAQEARGKTLQALAGDAKVEQTDWLSSQSTTSLETLTKKGIDANKILQMVNAGSTITFEHNNTGYVVRLDAIKPVNDTDFSAAKQSLATTVAREKNGIYAAGFIASLYRTATIMRNNSELPLAV